MLAVVMGLTLVACGNRANPVSDFEYGAVLEGIVIKKCDSNTLDVKIPAKIDGKPVVGIGKEAFKDKGMMEISFPDSVTSIGESAFAGCTGLTSIALPGGVTSIGKAAFDGCAGLTSIVIPDGVTYTGSRAFGQCTSLPSVTIPDSVSNIYLDAFKGCTGLDAETRARILQINSRAKFE